MLKRILSLCSVLLLLITAFANVTVNASGQTQLRNSGGTYNYYYRSQLDSLGKEIYDLCVTEYIVKSTNNSVEANLSNPIKFNANINKGKLVEDDNYKEAKEKFMSSCENACLAFMYDHPELFWIYYFYMDFFYSIENTSVVTNSDIQNQSISAIGYIDKIKLTPIEYFTDAYNNMTTFNIGVNNVYNQIKLQSDSNASRYTIIKNIHDYMCDNLSYNHSTGGIRTESFKYSSTAAGLFTNMDKKLVCAGYSKAFKVLCDKFGIPCVLVLGGTYKGDSNLSHMWNYVQMENGIWYAMDVTWNDIQSQVHYKHFLAGNSSTPSNYRESFFSNHYQNGKWRVYQFKFTYPQISSLAYPMDEIPQNSQENGTTISDVLINTEFDYSIKIEDVVSNTDTLLTLSTLPSAFEDNNNQIKPIVIIIAVVSFLILVILMKICLKNRNK